MTYEVRRHPSPLGPPSIEVVELTGKGQAAWRLVCDCAELKDAERIAALLNGAGK